MAAESGWKNFGNTVSGAIRADREGRAIEDILGKAKQAQRPSEHLDLMGSVLRNVSAERRPEVLNFLQDRYKLSREQSALDQYVEGGGNTNFSTDKRSSSNSSDPTVIPVQTQDSTNENGRIRELIGTPESLDQRSRELIRSQPNRYRDIESARNAAQQEFNSQQSVLSGAEEAFDSYVKRAIEKEGSDTYRDLPGEMQNKYRQDLRKEALQGKSTSADLGNKKAQSLLDFAKSRTNLRNSTAWSRLWGLSEKDSRERLDAARKAYQKEGQLELFENDLVNNLNLSSPIAAFVAFPPSSNKEIGKYLSDSKKLYDNWNPLSGSKIQQSTTGIRDKSSSGSKKRTEADIAKVVSNNLSPEDSLSSIAVAFNAKGYDPQKILSDIQARWKAGTLALTPRQERELQKRGSFGATLNDLAYFNGMGLNPKEIVDGG